MGKTNLLDAIYFLSFCKSHLHTPDGQLINQIEDVCVIEGNYEVEGQIEEIFCAMKRGQRKMFKRNQKTYEKLSEHIGLMPLVIVSPADSELISGGSDTRRRLLDLMISQRDKNYLHALIQYNKALAQRNQLLRNQSQESTLFDVLEMQLGNYGQTIFDKRAQMVRTFIPLFNEYYQFICQSAEEVNLKYVSTLEDEGLEGKLAASRERDYLLGFTSQGVHKDDVEMTLGERLIRHSGSQGQNKTFLIALKLAQFSLLANQGGTKPILLLDDIFDKLDAERVTQIVQLVGGQDFGQIFITDTNRKYLDQILSTTQQNFSLFEVNKGNILTLEEKSL